ncbi:replication factor C small subunit DNA polymerase clamp loader subunit [Serratia phage X20]|uniref:Sliding-clamp-loader large subunit n=1 Tax=Serratia phage X20 TaxID=2006942 RepID=A0A1Z1LZ05_9CAUD|nr:clamp loader of DNA polymerase [Serratia phage X20]ARW58022.1 replication factor C small subunit DNA polymerase clamp loader subunit [Serratia phage X20]QYN80494.1 replication factor C small subunit [Kosakonia phage Kc304]UJJ22032.1 DNA polymerase clamp loader subunit [Erwinia phage Virsaitis27]
MSDIKLSVNKNEFMFEQKYRPTTIDECILPQHDYEVFKAIVAKGTIPHMILQSNSPGTGKTTVARALCNDINADMLFVNGSDCRIDFVRGELTRFASSLSIEGRRKVIVIDEFDRNGLAESQRHLRSFMEAYSSNCSIIITANNLEGIIAPLRSRCDVIKFGEPRPEDEQRMQRQMLQRLIAICKNEDIKVEDPKVLAALVKKNFPEFRKTINQLDHYSKKGVIDAGILSVVMNTQGSIDDVVQALKSKDVKTLRSLAPKYSNDFSNFIERLLSEMYTKVTPQSIIRMYEIVGESNQYFGIAANIEIHLTYMFIQLVVEMQWL